MSLLSHATKAHNGTSSTNNTSTELTTSGRVKSYVANCRSQDSNKTHTKSWYTTNNNFLELNGNANNSRLLKSSDMRAHRNGFVMVSVCLRR